MIDNYLTSKVKKALKNSEKITVNKHTSEFIFSRDFFNFDGEEDYVSIKLTVNYLENRFSILPINGDLFNFQHCCPESIKLHRSILSVMAEAYEYGAKEVAGDKNREA